MGRICLTTMITAITFALGADLCPAAETVVLDGVPHIRNGAQPAEGRREVQLKELWRAGGEDDDVLFGAVGSVLADRDGNVYVADSQLNEVAVFSPQGAYLRKLGGEGDGPGEIRRMGGIFFQPDGRLGMIQTYPGRVVVVNLDGTPNRTYSFQSEGQVDSNFGVLIAGLARGGDMFLTGFEMSMNGPLNTQTYYLSLCSGSGVEQHRFFEKEYTINYGDFVADELGIDFVWNRWDVGPDGLLYAAPHRNRYEIQVLRPDGSIVKVIEREFESYRRTADEKEQARLFVEAYNRNHPVPPRLCNAEDMEADIGGLRVAPNGELWVVTSRSIRNLPAGTAIQFDLFDDQGTFVRQVAIQGSFDPARDLLQFLQPDRLVVVLGAAEGYLNSMGVSSDAGEAEEAPPTEVICYQLL